MQSGRQNIWHFTGKKGQQLRELWEEFESQVTPEAKFAKVMDNIQPMMLNDASDGKSWEEHGVRLDWILKRNENTHKGSEKLWEYAYEEFVDKNVKLGHIIK